MAIKEQLNTSDESFLDGLTLPGPAARKLAGARQNGDAAATVAVVADYFRSRKTPRWAYYMHGTPWHETDAPGCVIEKAERLLVNGFINSWPPHQQFDLGAADGEPDWVQGLKVAGTSIGRWTFVAELSTAFALTGNERYATRNMGLMRSNVRQIPFNLHPRFEEDHDIFFGGDGNHTLTVAYRIFRMTDFLHSGAFHARRSDGAYILSDADLFWLVKQLWFYACQYYRFIGDRRRRDNHHLVDHGHTPYVTGMAFPEFAISQELVREGAEIIRFHFGSNLLKDGSYTEHSAEYQYHILYHFLHPLAVSQANGTKLLTEKQVTALRRWVQFSVRAVKPDGWLPAIGDSGGRPLVHLLGALAGPVMTPELAGVAKALGIWPGKNVNASMSDIQKQMQKIKPGEPAKIGLSAYFLHKGTQPRGTCREPATCQYPNGGYTFFRSAWNADADYLAVSHFPPNMPGGHAHWDPMSFLLHTKGQTLIGEPASHLYGDKRFHGHGDEPTTPSPTGERPKPLYRGYTYSVNSHNCLVMNDDFLKPIEAMNHGTFWGGYPPVCNTGIFTEGGPIEVAEIWHDANPAVRMRRFFLHLRSIGFAFVDIITSNRTALSPMQYSQYFHFEGDVELAPELPDGGAPMRAFLNDASCLIVPGREMESRWKTWRDPYVHDVYPVPATKGLPWIGELTRRIRGSGVFATFFLTHCNTDTPPLRYLGAKPAAFFDWHHEALTAHRLDLGGGDAGSILLASTPFGKKLESPEMTTDAELAVALLDAKGKTQTWGMARGSTLVVNGRTLHRGRVREWIAI
ncbi:MAG: heparinase II/III family protein [Phycisphaerales bacterium]|nr:heparinase II/III family protein [Phycisphaerales bacterium]